MDRVLRNRYLVGVEGLEGWGGARAVEGAADAEPVVQDLQLCTEKPAGGEGERETVRKRPHWRSRQQQEHVRESLCRAPGPAAGRAPRAHRPGSRGRPRVPGAPWSAPPRAEAACMSLAGHFAVTQGPQGQAREA